MAAARAGLFAAARPLVLLLALAAAPSACERFRDQRPGVERPPQASSWLVGGVRRSQRTRPAKALTTRSRKYVLPVSKKKVVASGSKKTDKFGSCNRLWEPDSDVLADDNVQACIDQSVEELRKKADTYMGVLKLFIAENRCSYPNLRKDWAVQSSAAPCLSKGSRGDDGVPRQCVKELGALMEDTGDTAWLYRITATVNAKRDIAWAVSRIGEVVPGVSDQLLALGSGLQAAMLSRACSMSRMDYCFAILDYPGTEKKNRYYVRVQGAFVLGAWMVSACHDPSREGCEKALSSAPAIVAALKEYYESACASIKSKGKQSRCNKVMSLSSRLCFFEPLSQDEEAMDVCTTVFATFAVGPSGELPSKSEPPSKT